MIDAEFKQTLTPDVIRQVVDLIPDEWAVNAEEGLSANDIREVYYQFLSRRVENSANFLNEALHARKTLI